MHIFTVIKGNRFFFPVACTAALTLLFISEGSYLRSVRALDNISTMGEASTSILVLQHKLLNAETGQRGYLLTHQQAYLEPYRASFAEIDEAMASLSLYYADKPAMQREFLPLRALIVAKRAELASTIRLVDEGEIAAATRIVMGHQGKDSMNAIRAIILRLLENERIDAAEQRRDVYDTLMISRIGLAALTAVSLLALFVFLRQSLMHRNLEQTLSEAVQGERDRLEIEVALRTAELSDLTRHLLSAREDERARLARNLHDDLGSLLTSAKLDTARIKSRIAKTAPEALDLLAHLVETLNSSIALGRGIIENLRPSALSNLGLVATLEILAREFGESGATRVHCDLTAQALDGASELMIYRLVQEALTNITKYAHATDVWITLALVAGQVEASVRDNGVGYDAANKPASAYGLMGMRFRVEAEGGTLTVVSAPGQGTLIRARLPRQVA